MFFVERLESMLANGKKLPLTSNVVIDQAAALELIDELRHAIPEEVQSARRINSDAERILERAEQEAENIVARAQEHAAYLIGERGLTEAAEAEGRRILDEADAEAVRHPERRRRVRGRRPRPPRGRRRPDARGHPPRHRGARDARASRRPPPLADDDDAWTAARRRRRRTTPSAGPRSDRPPPDERRSSSTSPGCSASRPAATATSPSTGPSVDLGDGPASRRRPREVAVRLARTNRGLLVVTAGVTTASPTPAAGASRPAEVAVAVDVDEEVLPSLDLASGRPLDTQRRSRRSLRLSDHHELDLETLVREAIQLAEPIAPLCRPDCRGPVPGLRRRPQRGPHDHGARARSTRASRRSGRSARTKTAETGYTPPSAPAPSAAVPTGQRQLGTPRAGTPPESGQGATTPMGLPKRKVSHARQGDRRAHLALTVPASSSAGTATR